MQYSAIDIQSLAEILTSAGKFSLNSQQYAHKLSKTPIQGLPPLLIYLGHCLTLPPQNKKVLTSSLALRLIKQTMLEGSYTFYLQISRYIIPILYEYLQPAVNSKQSKFSSLQQFKSSQRCKELLKQKWYLNDSINIQHASRQTKSDILNDPEIKSCGNFLELLYQFFGWNSHYISLHPTSSSEFQCGSNMHKKAHFSSYFSVIRQLNNKLFIKVDENMNYKFYKQQSKHTFIKQLYQNSATELNDILKFCQKLTKQYMQTKSIKSLNRLQQYIYYTADSYIIDIIIKTLTSQLIPQKQPSSKFLTNLKQSLSSAIQISQLKTSTMDQIDTFGNISHNQYDYDEIQYHTKVAYFYIPLLQQYVYNQSHHDCEMDEEIYQSVIKLRDGIGNLNESQYQLQITDLYFYEIYTILGKSLARRIQNNNGRQVRNQPKQVYSKSNKLNILKITNRQKAQSLKLQYSKLFVLMLNEIQRLDTQAQEIKKVNKNQSFKTPKFILNQQEIYRQNDPEEYIQLENDEKNKRQSKQSYNLAGSFNQEQIKSYNSAFQSDKLSSKIKSKLSLRRLATFKRKRQSGDMENSPSTISQPQLSSIQKINRPRKEVEIKHVYRETVMLNSNRISADKSRNSNRSVQSSLADRIKRRRAEINSVKSAEKSKIQNYPQNRQFDEEKKQIANQYYKISNQNEKSSQKNGTVSFFNKKLQQNNNALKFKSDQFHLKKADPEPIRKEIVHKKQSNNWIPDNFNNEYQNQNIVLQSLNRPYQMDEKIGTGKQFSKQITYKKLQRRNQNKKNMKNIQSHKIFIEETLQKPSFGFNRPQTKKQSSSQSSSFVSETDEPSDSLISPTNIKDSNSFHNFADVLDFQRKGKDNKKLKVIKNNGITGYLLPVSPSHKKQENLLKKIQSYKQVNQLYDERLKQKERQIAYLNKKMKKQKDQLEGYQNTLVRAYDNIYQNPDSLLLLSTDNDNNNLDNLDEKVRHLRKIDVKLEGLSKKLFKQIIYGKALLFENQYIQIGFSNNQKEGEIVLYYQMKKSCKSAHIYIENAQQCGYSMHQDQFNVRLGSVPEGKRLKFRIFLVQHKKSPFQFQFMKLFTIIRTNSNSQKKYECTLPFCLYRNFIHPIKPIKNPKILGKFVTNWQQCSEEFYNNKNKFLFQLFNNGIWADDNIFEIWFLSARQNIGIRIYTYGKFFAIEFQDIVHIDVVVTVASLLKKFH